MKMRNFSTKPARLIKTLLGERAAKREHTRNGNKGSKWKRSAKAVLGYWGIKAAGLAPSWGTGWPGMLRATRRALRDFNGTLQGNWGLAAGWGDNLALGGCGKGWVPCFFASVFISPSFCTEHFFYSICILLPRCLGSILASLGSPFRAGCLAANES